MSVFVIHDVFTNDEKHKKVKEFLEKENISFSEYSYIGEAYVTEEVKFRVNDNEFYTNIKKDSEIIDVVSDNVLELDDLFCDVCDIIDEELEKYQNRKNLVVLIDIDSKSKEEMK